MIFFCVTLHTHCRCCITLTLKKADDDDVNVSGWIGRLPPLESRVPPLFVNVIVDYVDTNLGLNGRARVEKTRVCECVVLKRVKVRRTLTMASVSSRWLWWVLQYYSPIYLLPLPHMMMLIIMSMYIKKTQKMELNRHTTCTWWYSMYKPKHMTYKKAIYCIYTGHLL